MEIPDGYGYAAFKYLSGTNGEVCLTTMGFHNTLINDAATIAPILSGNVWQVSFPASHTSDEWYYEGCYVLINIGGVHQAYETSDHIVGTETSNPPSPAVAAGVKKQTSYAGKKYRGRMYLPSALLFEDDISGVGVLSGGLQTFLQGAVDDLLSNMAGEGYPAYLLHSDATAPTAINELIVRGNVRTQRRRQKLGG